MTGLMFIDIVLLAGWPAQLHYLNKGAAAANV